MSEGYVGEIRMFAGNFAPAGWALCQGQLIAISENPTLFNLIGTTYGGDGQNTFGLPNLQGRIPLHQGTGAGQTVVIGESAGVEQVTLTSNQIPIHNHAPQANTAASASDPTNKVLAGGTANWFTASAPSVNLAAALQNSGGNQPHENMMPYLTINFIISLFGVYPTQN